MTALQKWLEEQEKKDPGFTAWYLKVSQEEDLASTFIEKD